MNVTNLSATLGRRFHYFGSIFVICHADDKKVFLRSEKYATRKLSFAHEDYLRKLQSGDLVPVDDATSPPLPGQLAAPLSKTELDTVQRHLIYVRRIVEEFGSVLPKKGVLRITISIARDLEDPKPPCYNSIRTWVGKYLVGGKNPLTLRKNGRKSPKKRHRIPDYLVDLVGQILQRTYFHELKPSLLSSYITLVTDIENKVKTGILPPNTYLPQSTFYRYVATLNPVTVYAARHGKHAAIQKFRANLHIMMVFTPLERVECDSQYVDIILIDENGNVIGRPYLTLMIDIYSRCVIGWSLSFTPNSAVKTLQALRHAISMENGMPYGGIMQELIVDNGPEFVNSSLITVAASLGITIRFVAPRSGDQKPHVERVFRTINDQVVHRISGTTKSNPTARGDYDSVTHAMMSLDDLRAIFDEFLKNTYPFQLHQGIDDTPDNKWKRGIQDPPARLESGEVAALCRSVIYRATHRGRIRLFDLEFYSPALPLLKPKKNRHGGKLEILYDAADLSYVLVRNPANSQEYVRCEGLDMAYQKGLSLYEHVSIKRFKQQTKQAITNNYLLRGRFQEWLTSFVDKKRRKLKQRIDDILHFEPADYAELALDGGTPEAFPEPTPATLSPHANTTQPQPLPLPAPSPNVPDDDADDDVKPF